MTTTTQTKTKVILEATYETHLDCEIELPASKTWANVTSFSFDLKTVDLTFDDGTRLEVKQSEPEPDKRPSSYEIYATDDDGEIDYDEPLEEPN